MAELYKWLSACIYKIMKSHIIFSSTGKTIGQRFSWVLLIVRNKDSQVRIHGEQWGPQNENKPSQSLTSLSLESQGFWIWSVLENHSCRNSWLLTLVYDHECDLAPGDFVSGPARFLLLFIVWFLWTLSLLKVQDSVSSLLHHLSTPASVAN